MWIGAEQRLQETNLGAVVDWKALTLSIAQPPTNKQQKNTGTNKQTNRQTDRQCQLPTL